MGTDKKDLEREEPKEIVCGDSGPKRREYKIGQQPRNGAVLAETPGWLHIVHTTVLVEEHGRASTARGAGVLRKRPGEEAAGQTR